MRDVNYVNYNNSNYLIHYASDWFGGFKPKLHCRKNTFQWDLANCAEENWDMPKRSEM